MDAKDLVIKARVLLIRHHPFYASLALKLRLEENSSIETADVDGKTIRYNPSFVAGLDLPQTAGLLVHEVLHVALYHHLRLGKRDLTRWNYAADYAINPIILQAGLKLPDGALYNTAYLNKSAEQIYTILPEEPTESGPGCGQVREPAGDETERRINEAAVRKMVVEAMTDARMRGKLPTGIDRLIQKALQPVVEWKAALAVFLTEKMRSDYSLSRPNPRFLHLGLYLPILQNDGNGQLVLIIDTSMSISQRFIDQFAAEIQLIADQFRLPLIIIYVDDAVRSVQQIDVGEAIGLKPVGNGCTDFRPGFEYIDQEGLQPKAVVYLTDGACDLLPAEPSYPVLWAKFGHYPFQPPFGELIEIPNF